MMHHVRPRLNKRGFYSAEQYKAGAISHHSGLTLSHMQGVYEVNGVYGKDKQNHYPYGAGFKSLVKAKLFTQANR